MKVGQKAQEATPLSHHEDKALAAEEQHLQDVKDGVELRQGVKYEADDLSALDKRLAAIRDLRIRRGVHAPAAGKEREYLEKREKMLRETLMEMNPTFKENQYTRPSDGPRYSRLVSLHLQNMLDPEYGKMVSDWKATRRKLFPDDPYAADTRLLYRE